MDSLSLVITLFSILLTPTFYNQSFLGSIPVWDLSVPPAACSSSTKSRSRQSLKESWRRLRRKSVSWFHLYLLSITGESEREHIFQPTTQVNVTIVDVFPHYTIIFNKCFRHYQILFSARGVICSNILLFSSNSEYWSVTKGSYEKHYVLIVISKMPLPMFTPTGTLVVTTTSSSSNSYIVVSK